MDHDDVLRDGETINCKYRDKEKNFRMAGGAERLLYGLDDLGVTTVIVEGEMDKLAVDQPNYASYKRELGRNP